MSANDVVRRFNRWTPPPVEEFHLEIKMETTLNGRLAERAIQAAARHGRTPTDLLADVIAKVLEDDLIAAILDE